MVNRKPYEFDPDKLAKSKTYWVISKTFHVDWSGWLERQFRKLFKKEDKNDILGKDEGSV